MSKNFTIKEKKIIEEQLRGGIVEEIFKFKKLVRSNLGNVKTIISESISENKTKIDRLLVDELDFVFKKEQKKGNFTYLQYDRTIQGDKFSVVLILNPDGDSYENLIILTIFLTKEGRESEKITSKVSGEPNGFVAIESEKFSEEAKNLIKKALLMTSSHEEIKTELPIVSFDSFKSMLEPLGFDNMSDKGNHYTFMKNLQDYKSFKLFIIVKGERVIFCPIVIDEEAKKDSSLFGGTIPINIGTINIEKDSSLKSDPMTLIIPTSEIESKKEFIIEFVRRSIDVANRYEGKHQHLKKWNDIPPIR